jgi:hypothetical protein
LAFTRSINNSQITEGLDFLPEELVRDMLSQYKGIINDINNELLKLEKLKEKVRKILENKGMLKNDNALTKQPIYPTTVGVDGSWSVIKQVALDIVAIAAVAVEGLIPPKEERKWPKPHHIVKIYPVKHSDDTSTLCRALMFSYELELVVKAPHKIVYVDGSLTSQLIAFGQAFSAIKEDIDNKLPSELKEEIINRLDVILDNYLNVLKSERVDKLYVGIPKYSSRREILDNLHDGDLTEDEKNILERWNDKALLTYLLKEGEVVGPIKLTTTKDKWHLSAIDDISPSNIDKKEAILNALNNLYVIYYKPSPAHPALRLEIGGNIANNNWKISILLESLNNQARNLGIIEPYPLYIADSFVKNIFPSLIQLKDLTISDIGSNNRDLNFQQIFLSLHEYRSESGLE